jgi:hypothetical protein
MRSKLDQECCQKWHHDSAVRVIRYPVVVAPNEGLIYENIWLSCPSWVFPNPPGVFNNNYWHNHEVSWNIAIITDPVRSITLQLHSLFGNCRDVRTIEKSLPGFAETSRQLPIPWGVSYLGSFRLITYGHLSFEHCVSKIGISDEKTLHICLPFDLWRYCDLGGGLRISP